jgi:phosphate transport system substrate-binding protein
VLPFKAKVAVRGETELPTRKGRCTNFGGCTLADKREVIQVKDQQEYICPECERPLSGLLPAYSPRSPWKIVAAGIALLAVAAFALFHFLRRPATHGTTGGTGNAKIILRLCGSNTIGSDLGPALVRAFLKDQGATNVDSVPGPRTDETSVQGNLAGNQGLAAIQIRAHGSTTAFTGLGDASCDIGMSSRKIKPEEVTRLAGLGDMTSPQSEHVLGLDGVTVIVNQANPLSSIPEDRLGGIFLGRMQDWSGVGGTAGPIHIYALDDNSGTFDIFKTLVMGNGSLPSTAKRLEDSATLSDAVANDAAGIGFVGLPFVRKAKALIVSQPGLAPVAPSRMSLATEDYPLSRRLYLYTPQNPQNPYMRKFIDFVLSTAGQEIVGTNGFVTQIVSQETQKAAPNAPAEYKRLTVRAKRLSLDFRFRSGRSDLDNKAQLDIGHVIDFVKTMHYAPENVMLLGFADSSGDSKANQSLSEDRAHAVEQQFEAKGLKPGVVKGFGDNLPLAPNDTEEGRWRNRRVEVWVLQ